MDKYVLLKNKMQVFKKIVFVIGFSCTETKKEITESKRPNIVWIMLEDWSPDLVCYGTKGIETPVTDNIDHPFVKKHY